MGRKLLLTVHKRRSNERQKSKERKLHLLKLAEEARKIKCVYDGPLESKGKPLSLCMIIAQFMHDYRDNKVGTQVAIHVNLQMDLVNKWL